MLFEIEKVGRDVETPFGSGVVQSFKFPYFHVKLEDGTIARLKASQVRAHPKGDHQTDSAPMPRWQTNSITYTIPPSKGGGKKKDS